MFESSMVLRREPLPRPELDALLGRYRREADRYGPNSKKAVKIRNELIEVNMRLVATVAKRYRVPTGWEFDELLAIGSTGLVTAIERFELARGHAFSTYASWWIRHAISRALADLAGVVRVPVHAGNALSRESRGDATESSTKWMNEARAARHVLSLDAPITADGEARPWVELQHDRDALSADEAVLAAEDAARVREALAALPEKYRAVVNERMAERTLSEIGTDMGRSRERVRQLQNEAFDVMRSHLGEA